MSSNNSSRAPASSACGSLACRTEAASDAAWGLAWDMGDANVSSQKTDGTREPPPTPAQGGK
ncbi:hypothetical protein L486_06573 [Kwoniella mangroviensis CBS 10435]|uniref:Uncharacterized protein n=1 Tax=Kwoniella mangroviensis CBS 10435 TaxID=1331196 RepID=A0A1B9IKC8_9TREE|nr:hypothetical protein L486_06573 [Kwoniella mangroviensis CBS 10435]OCF71684.1 hypothetical protein I204_07746 [Kwoniella mangroviensis CBS 8886]